MARGNRALSGTDIEQETVNVIAAFSWLSTQAVARCLEKDASALLKTSYRGTDASQVAELINRLSTKNAIIQAGRLNNDGGTNTYVATPGDVQGYMRNGFNICIRGIDVLFPVVHSRLATIRGELGWPGLIDVRAYASCAGTVASLHYDSRFAFVVQISGRKRWRYSPTSHIRRPAENAEFARCFGKTGSRGEDTAHLKGRNMIYRDFELVETVLEPGVVLFIPAGAWHETEAVDTSLALNISFNY